MPVGDTGRAVETGLREAATEVVRRWVAFNDAKWGSDTKNVAGGALQASIVALRAALASSRPAAPDSLDVERLATAICSTRDPAMFAATVGAIFVDDECRSWAGRVADEYARLAALPSEARSDG